MGLSPVCMLTVITESIGEARALARVGNGGVWRQ